MRNIQPFWYLCCAFCFSRRWFAHLTQALPRLHLSSTTDEKKNCELFTHTLVLTKKNWVIYTYTWKPRQNGRKMTSFRRAMGRHGQVGIWRGQWTGRIGSAPLQISGCGLDGALSWCGQGEGQSFLVSSWSTRAVAAAPSFQTCFACVHMYILYACVYICVCVYVGGHDICIYMHVCMHLYIYAFIHLCMCMCMHICA